MTRRGLLMGAFRKYLADKCLTFTGVNQSLTITMTGVSRVFEYSYDKDTWVRYTGGAIPFQNDTLYLRGDNPSGLSTGTNSKVVFSFGGTSEVYCSGNIMHLLNHMEDLVEIPCNYCFYQLFADCRVLRSAPDLPATTLKANCYYYMFRQCTYLVSAPVLPAKTLVSNCYSYMFNGCTNLNYIKALFTTTPSNTYTNAWVQKVASSGTFVKASDATWNVTGNNAVPNKWTVIKE